MSRFSLDQYTDADKLLLVEYDLPVRYTRETVDHLKSPRLFRVELERGRH